jgi:hypothetical protein
MTLQEYNQLVLDAEELAKKTEWRQGQAVFNLMDERFPEEADRIRGTGLDMFNNDYNIEEYRRALKSYEWKYETYILIEIAKKHGKIVVGVDFDDTIFPLHNNEYIAERAKSLVAILRELREYITLCLWTIADEQSLAYKVALMESWAIKPDYVNASPVNFGEARKPYFNILLDDKAGLNESIKILKEYKDYVTD